jgi:hypothetical protein
MHTSGLVLDVYDDVGGEHGDGVTPFGGSGTKGHVVIEESLGQVETTTHHRPRFGSARLD